MGQQCAVKDKLEPASYVCEIASAPSVMADVLCIHGRRDNKMEDDTRFESRLLVCHASPLPHSVTLFFLLQTCLQIKCFRLVSASHAIKIGWKTWAT